MNFSSEAPEWTIQRKYLLVAFKKLADQGQATYSPQGYSFT